MCGRDVQKAAWVLDFTDYASHTRGLWKNPEYRKKVFAGIKRKQRGPDKKPRKSALRIGPEEIARAVASAKRLKEKVDRRAREAKYGIIRRDAA